MMVWNGPLDGSGTHAHLSIDTLDTAQYFKQIKEDTPHTLTPGTSSCLLSAAGKPLSNPMSQFSK